MCASALLRSDTFTARFAGCGIPGSRVVRACDGPCGHRVSSATLHVARGVCVGVQHIIAVCAAVTVAGVRDDADPEHIRRTLVLGAGRFAARRITGSRVVRACDGPCGHRVSSATLHVARGIGVGVQYIIAVCAAIRIAPDEAGPERVRGAAVFRASGRLSIHVHHCAGVATIACARALCTGVAVDRAGDGDARCVEVTCIRLHRTCNTSIASIARSRVVLEVFVDRTPSMIAARRLVVQGVPLRVVAVAALFADRWNR